MSEDISKPRRSRRVAIQAAVGIAILAAFVFAGWYLTSSRFNEWVRKRLVSRIEQMTGGRADIGSFQWDLSRLQFDIRNLTVHGLEAPEQVPYFHTDQLLINVRIVSLWRQEIALNSLQVERPVIHLIVYPDGHTNQPKPRVETHDALPTIFDLEIKNAELRNGELLLNDTAVPFDVSGADMHAGLRYGDKDQYQGTLKLAIHQAQYGSYRAPAGNFDVAFSLRPNEFDVAGLHLTAGDSKVDASGTLSDFANPTAKGNYRATLDATDLVRMFRVREVRRGKVDLNGTVIYEGAAVSSRGKAVVRNADYLTRGLHIPSLDAAADFEVDRNKLALTHIAARVLGGIVNGDGVLRWAEPVRDGKTEQSGDFRLTARNRPAGMVADGFSTPDLRLEKLNAAGIGQGRIRVQWRGTPARALVDLDVTMSPLAALKGNELPVTGALRGTYRLASQQLSTDSLSISLPFLNLSANGTLGSKQEPLHLTLDISDLRRIQPLLAMVNQANSPAADVAGQLRFRGELQGNPLTPSVTGHVEVGDLTFPLKAIWTPPEPLDVATTTSPRTAPPKYVHLDSGTADVALSAGGISIQNGTVQHAGARALVNLGIGLFNGVFTDGSPVSARVAVQDASLADLEQIAGYNYPISGTVAADVNVHGTRLNLQGGGHVRITNASAYGQTISSAAANILFANQEAQVTNLLLLVHDHGQITGSGAYNLNQERFNFQVSGSNFELATIPGLNRNHVSVSGRLNFTGSGSGTIAAPVVNASAQLQNLVVNGERVGDARLLAVTQGDSMHVTARSNFQSAEVSLDGNIRLRDQMPATITLELSNFDFMPFLQSVFQTKMKGQSYVGGKVLVEGPLKDPTALTLRAEIPKLTAEMEGVELHNREPIRVSMANQIVRLDSVRLEGTDTRFRASGTVSLTGDRKIDLRANGRLNLKLVQSFNADMNSGGSVDVNMSVGGTLSNPDLVGEAKIANGAVSLIDFPNGLSSINGTLIFNEQRVQVQSLTARTGGGDIRIGGFATYNPDFAFNVTVQGDDVRMRYPQGVSTTGNLDLKLVGNLNSSTLSGDVTITRFSLNQQFDLANYLAKSVRPQEAPPASPLNNVRFNLHVVSTPQLQVESSLAKVSGNADLRIRGTPNNPVLLGRISITEGSLDFNGATYRIDRGDVSFVNPTHTEATIDVAATTRVRDYDITLRFSGEPARGLKTNYSSDPPLPAPDIINLLAFGQTREEAQIAATQGNQAMTETVSNAILGQAINNAVANRVQKFFGVSRVKISPEVGGAYTNPTAQITIEQQVSNKINVTYVSNLTQSSQQSIFVEYYLDRNVSLIAGRDQYGVVSFDVRIRQRKR